MMWMARCTAPCRNDRRQSKQSKDEYHDKVVDGAGPDAVIVIVVIAGIIAVIRKK